MIQIHKINSKNSNSEYTSMLYDAISCPPKVNYIIFTKMEKNYAIDSNIYDSIFSKTPRLINFPK